MSELRVLWQFMAIQMEQNDLLKEIAGKNGALQFWKNSVERGTHERDCHGRYWDSSIAVEEQRKLYQELELLNKEYKQNQERLEALRRQPFAGAVS